MINVHIPAVKVFAKSYSAYRQKKRVIANRGGTRSGKTYSLMQVMLFIAISERGRSIDVVSESLPHLKRGTLHDTAEIMDNWHLIEGTHFEENKTDHIITIRQTGSVIRFFSADDWGKVKGSRRDILYINECNRIHWETYRQLAVRTTSCIFIDWNPDAEFWFEQKGLNLREDTEEIVTTYKDNPFLQEAQIKEIESNKDDLEWWKVYGLGQVGQYKGAVYNNWDQCTSIPYGARLVGRGLDFGFTNDHTAIIDVYLCDGDLWLHERCYERGLTNDKIADKLRGLDGDVVADSAEMKSIAEIRNFGIRHIEPAEKGADSILNGIQILQRYKIHVTTTSLNLIYELRQYKWKEDKLTGEQLNIPIDKWNHALDAVRYVALNKLSNRPTKRGIRNVGL